MTCYGAKGGQGSNVPRGYWETCWGIHEVLKLHRHTILEGVNDANSAQWLPRFVLELHRSTDKETVLQQYMDKKPPDQAF